MIEQRLIHRRHTRHGGGLDALDRRQRILRVEARQQGHASTIDHGTIEHAGVGENVEQRQHTEDHVAFVRARIDCVDLPGIGGEILMRQHRTLGRTGRPAGVLQQGEIVFRIDHHRGERRVTAKGRPAGHIGAIRHRRQHIALEQFERKPLEARQHAGEIAHDQPVELT